jgi:hypothetical protein
MKVTTVRYRRLQSHDRGYGHDAVEAEAQVEAHETAEEAFGALQAWVNGQLGMTREINSLSDTLIGLAEDVRRKERDLTRVAEQVKRGREVIAEHEALGALAAEHKLDVPKAVFDIIGDGVPF